MSSKVVIDGVSYSEPGQNYPNPYYKTDHGLYSVPESQFYDYLQREGTIVKDYWNYSDYRCFFRRNKDTNQTNDNISIYYPVDNGIQPGTIITYLGRTYLILNQESLENRVYHRSDGLCADVMLSTYSQESLQDINLPCFSYDLTGTAPDVSEMMSTINGNVELITGDNEMSRKLKVNCEFNAMGNWYSVVGVNFKTGIARISAKIIQSPSQMPVYALEVNAESTYIQGDAVKLSASPTVNDEPVLNATLQWSCTNNEVATVDEYGNVLFLSVGSCAISCYWKEHDIISTVYIEVVAEPTTVDLKCEIIGNERAYLGSTATYTATFYMEDGVTKDTTAVPVWSLDVPDDIIDMVSIAEQSGNTITVQVGNASSAKGKTFGVILTDEAGRYHTSMSVTISSWF